MRNIWQKIKIVGTAKLGLIYELNRTCDGKKSGLVDLTFNRWNQIITELKHWQEVREAFWLAA